MKKALIFVLSLMMIAIFAVGCSSDESKEATATATPVAEATMEATTEPAATAEATTPAAETTTEATATAATQG